MKFQVLSNTDLLTRFARIVRTERKITHIVLRYIAEIDSRRLYLDRAYPSLYEFLVKEFGYSSSAALRRIESARLLREVPEVANKIESGAVNLSQLSKVQQAVRIVQKLEDRKVSSDEKRQLIGLIENATQEQTDLILSQNLQIPLTVENKERTHHDESVTLTVTFTKEQITLLKKTRDSIAHSVPVNGWSEVLSYLAEKEYKRRSKIRLKKQGTIANKSKAKENTPSLPNDKIKAQKKLPLHSHPLQIYSEPENEKPKALLNSVKKAVIIRDKHCQFKDPKTGKLCGSTRFLQVDHRKPLWAGGSHDIENLQVLCSQHNRHKYLRESHTRYGGSTKID